MVEHCGTYGLSMWINVWLVREHTAVQLVDVYCIHVTKLYGSTNSREGNSASKMAVGWHLSSIGVWTHWHFLVGGFGTLFVPYIGNNLWSQLTDSYFFRWVCSATNQTSISMANPCDLAATSPDASVQLMVQCSSAHLSSRSWRGKEPKSAWNNWLV